MKLSANLLLLLSLCISLILYAVWFFITANKATLSLNISIAVIFILFFIIYKIFKHFGDFKENQNISLSDTVFISIFFVLLLIPMSHIDHKKISSEENRALEKYQPLFINGNINTQFGSNFEKWFNDRFYNRENIIKVFHKLLVKISYKRYESNRVYYIKESNFVFPKEHTPSRKTFDFDVDIISKNLDRINDFCLEHNIKFYVLIVPFNLHIYQNYAKPFDDPQGLDKLNSNIKALQKRTKAKVIYPFDELKQAANTDWVYFKTDHHWTDKGAFVGYQTLMKEIAKDYAQIKPVEESDFIIKEKNLVRSSLQKDFHEGSQLKHEGFFLNDLKDKILDTDYKFYYHKNSDILKERFIETRYEKIQESYYPYGVNLKVSIFGNSMNENLLQFFSYTFRKVKLIEFKIFREDYKKELETYKPDIMIFCISGNGLKFVKKFLAEE